MNLNLLQTGLSLKTSLSLYLTLNLTKKNYQSFVFQKIKSASMPDHHVKEQPAASTFVRKKGGITCDRNHGTRTPCISRE